MNAVGCGRGSWGFWNVDVRDQKTDQDGDMDHVRGLRTILEALDDQSLQRGLSQRYDGVAIACMVHAKTGIDQCLQ